MLRASMIPSSRPLMTRPTNRPRSDSGARCAATGSTICATTDVKPSSTEKTRKAVRFGATEASPAAITVTTRTREARARFSIRSPRGTSTMIPAA
jgi:hypothetical protein